VTASTTLTVGQAAIVSLAVLPTAAAIPLGTTQQFQAIATYTDGTTQDLTASASWSSSVLGVAVVNAAGLANSLFAGTSTISASFGGASSGSTLTVIPAVPVSLAVEPVTASIAFQAQQQFQAFMTYSDGSVQNVTSLVLWTSSAPAIATVSGTGLATGVGAGGVNIYASASNGMIAGGGLTVAAPSLISIAVTPSNTNLALSSSQQFAATGTFADGSTQNLTAQVTWTSSNSNVLSISGSGLAIALQFGISSVTATSGSTSGSAAVTVPTVSAVSSSLFDMTINKAGTPWPTDTFYGQRLLGTNTLWGNIETANGTYSWTTLNKFVSDAQSHGVDLIYTFLGVPQWASSNPNDTSCSSWPGSCDPPNDLNSDGTGSNAQWDAFVTNIATQVGTKIKYWELWDEPNNAAYVNPKTWTTAQWIRMASDARQIIRGINPNAVILSPGIAPGTTWLTNFLAAGGGNYVDVIAFHGYANPPETVVSLITPVRAAIAAAGVSSLPLWDTEASWGLNTVLTDPNMQAGSVARLYLLHAANNVARLYWYGWEFTTRGTLWQSAASTNCATPNNGGYICLAGIAYAQASNWMNGAVLSGCSSSGTTWTCSLARPGGYFAQVMWDSSQTCSNGVCQTTPYTPPSQFIQYRDLYGSTHNVTGPVPLGAEPVILENQAAGETILSQFFGMGVSSSSDMPKVSYGTLSHPPLAWTAIEGTARGSYNFGTIDSLVGNAPKDANGVALIDLALGWTPSWAVANQSSCVNQGTTVGCTAPPDNIQDWVNFVTNLINHYNGITAPHVKYYEIWNEANTAAFWTGSVSSLIAMAQTAYPILKQDPYSYVLTPSVVWSGGPSFMSAFLQGGGVGYADGLTFHGYTSQTGKGFSVPVPLPESTQSSNAPIQEMITSFREIADSNGMQGQPLMTTEGGWGVNGVTDPDMQAAWIAHYELIQAGLASNNNLQFQTWFAWGQGTSGTIETSQRTPTQAGNAYQQVYSWLVGNQASPCENAGNIWVCPLSANLAVWDSSQTCSNGVCSTSTYTPPPGYDHYIDLTGAAYPITATIALGVKPIILENWSSLTPTLVSIAVTPATASLVVGNTLQFTVTGNYSNGNTVNLTSSATWTSTALSVATITSLGLSTGVGEGAATISATVGGITGTSTLTVVPLALVSVAVTPANASISVGNMRQFAAIGTFSDGSTQNLTSSVTWISSSSVVATTSNSIGSQGLTTAISTGVSNIEASLGAYSGAATLTVTPAITQGTLTQYLTTWGGLQRMYYLYIPKVVSPTPSLVLFLHATYAMPSIPLALVPQWEAIADQYGIFIIWPISLWDPTIQTWRWDCDGCESGFAVAPDDSGFIRSVILSVQNQYGISPGQTFVSGMSSGGYMTQRIGMEQSDVIAAIAPISGAQYIQPVGTTYVRPVVPNPISVYRLNGDIDTVVPYCGGTKGFWAGVMAYSPSMDEDLAFWSGSLANSCSTFTQSQPMCTGGEPTEGVNGQDATECKGGTEMIFVREPGIGHEWVTGTEVKIWAFFQTHGR
jgi:poly(3-hydroxybutyrate) depolymerase